MRALKLANLEISAVIQGFPDVLYPRTFRTQTIRTQSWDALFVPNVEMIRTQS